MGDEDEAGILREDIRRMVKGLADAFFGKVLRDAYMGKGNEKFSYKSLLGHS